ncbi:Os12g0603201 [Oryza sativa Japonica Group]|uniref:Os12g0603201 protein n=1 Tax=Oryza sativa subsp. japonica TaxID=39947 RepID=A0A0P0YCE0_ORYSJ|nr:Os12g0603201 [Oryza sativa Japonica Group]
MVSPPAPGGATTPSPTSQPPPLDLMETRRGCSPTLMLPSFGGVRTPSHAHKGAAVLHVTVMAESSPHDTLASLPPSMSFPTVHECRAHPVGLRLQ